MPAPVIPRSRREVLTHTGGPQLPVPALRTAARVLRRDMAPVGFPSGRYPIQTLASYYPSLFGVSETADSRLALWVRSSSM